MCRCFVLSDAVLQGERLGQGCGQLGIDPVVELEQIRLPGAVRADAVCPAVVGVGTEIFAVIGKVLRTSVGVGDAVRFAEHQHRIVVCYRCFTAVFIPLWMRRVLHWGWR